MLIDEPACTRLIKASFSTISAVFSKKKESVVQTLPLGVDISKKTFDTALLLSNRVKSKVFNNDKKGFGEFMLWPIFSMRMIIQLAW